jgi:hypothetical protein
MPRYDIATREILVWWKAVPDAGANLQAIERTIAPDPEHFGGFVNIAEPVGDPAAAYYDSPQPSTNHAAERKPNA